MKSYDLKKLDLKLYEEVLPCGLRIFVIPQKNAKMSYITLSTKYGSVQSEFIPYGKDKMVKVPDGIAHFLEHKMFEQKNGVDPFEFFASHGADANANTTNYKTTYLFSGSKYLKENIRFLLKYVFNPYFTDENVEKEKGIIEQEMLMYEDDPYSVLFENMTANLFNVHPIKKKVIGDKESVYSITKEDLYTCYNTFYQPSNMFLVATGNVLPKDIINTVKKYMPKKFKEPQKIVVKKYDEKPKVAKQNDSVKMNVNVPKVGIAYKIDISNIKLRYDSLYRYVSIFFDSRLGSTSDLNEKLKAEGIISEELYVSITKVDNYLCVYILGETKYPKKLINYIKEAISGKVTINEFERKRNVILASLITASDNIYAMNSKVMGNILSYDKVILNDYEVIKKLDHKKMHEIISKLDFSNYLTYIIKPK